ncbi:MAG TPA: peptidyl-prolyl cis-trans isomerase [Gemmatimonadales bacterium]|nr:peptidyl-prolyl cis-trans isomerase [Gemmatimonadales bacterium]
MRENAKWIFYILAVAFIGWLVFDVGMGITGRGQYGRGDVVLKVDGREVHLPQYDAAVQYAYEQFRRQSGGALTREDQQEVQNQVVDELVQALLLDRQYRKLGITATDQEVIQAAQSTPPPEVEESPDFQTNGQFDISKWQRYLASGSDPQFLESLEARYRQQIPQYKLMQYLTADVYVPDAKLWRIYRDQHESTTVAVAAVRPEQIPDQDVTVSDEEVQQYYERHKADFKRPRVAYVSFIAQGRFPSAEDSAAALARARAVRADLARGAKFEDVAKRESSDTASGNHGGDLGWIPHDGSGFDPQFVAGMRQLAPGALSQPVLSSFGYHIIRVDAVRHDSLHVRHILIPVELHGAHLDYVEARADTLDKLVAERSDGSALDSVGRKLGLRVVSGTRVMEGQRLTLGRYVIPDVSVWAFENNVGETSPVIDARPAYYVFRLDSLIPAGTPPLIEIRGAVLGAARLAKKHDAAARRADEVARALSGVTDLTRTAPTPGLTVQTVGPFTRLSPPPLLQGNALVVGAAFGLKPGERSGVIADRSGFFIVQGVRRVAADSLAWLNQKESQRQELLQPVRQARVQAYLAALRSHARIVDRRKELFRPGAGS